MQPWLRFTPTCVGTTGGGPRPPRTTSGSPPRAWGRPGKRSLLRSRTPVHPHVRGDDDAGRALLEAEATVHPHVRGDDSVWTVRVPGSDGSPPRAWGRRNRGVTSSRLDRRFTPTCVGTTATCSVNDAPRCGSPPRAWGRRELGTVRCVRRAVHPHVRGDDLALLQPRASWRFTPTCVGTTGSRLAAGIRERGSPPRAWGRLYDLSRRYDPPGGPRCLRRISAQSAAILPGLVTLCCVAPRGLGALRGDAGPGGGLRCQ